MWWGPRGSVWGNVSSHGAREFLNPLDFAGTWAKCNSGPLVVAVSHGPCRLRPNANMRARSHSQQKKNSDF
jgi:hypothetical protein